jgi:DNA-binding SARP family transcriptional activator
MGHRLNILGTLDLRDAGGTPVGSVLQQPRRLGLLVYLALADRDGMVKRDTILGLFWPEMSQENGRRALSQAIHFLRKSLGRDAIIGRGIEDLALNPDVVECDAARFQAAVKAGDLQAATATYGGDLLPGFFVSGAPEFDQWLSNARESLRRAAAEVFWSAAEEAKQQGRTVSAAASARRAAALASESETATRRLMEFLESIDDRAGALEAYDGLVRTLQSEYESTPSAKTRDIAERIRRNASVAVVSSTDSHSPLAPAVYRLRALPWRDIKERSKTLTGAAIIMVAFLSLWGTGKRVSDGGSVRTDPSVIIQPPEVFDAAMRDAASRILADASAALVAVPQVTVFAEGDAHFRLEPKVSSHEGELRVTARLIDITNGAIVRSAAFTATASDTAALGALALDMSEFARKAMGRYLRATAVAALTGADAETLSASMLARIRSDSLKDQGLSEYALLTLERADAALARTLETRQNAELYVERAEIAKTKFWVNLLPPIMNQEAANEALAEGFKYADAAIDLDSRNAAAIELHGLFAYSKWLTRSREANPEKHRAEAEKFLRAAVDLNPNAHHAWNALGSILLSKGEFASAYWAAERAYATDAYLDVGAPVTATLFAASLETGDLAAAERWCADVKRRAGDSWNSAFCSLQLIARRDDLGPRDISRAETIVAEVSKSAIDTPFMPLLDAILAVVYAKTGDHSKAH